MKLTQQERLIVKKARDRIADKKRWTAGTLARTARGKPCSPYGQAARFFCAEGALMVECAEIGEAGAGYLLSLFFMDADYGLAEINDGPYGHARVLAIFDKALAG